MILQSKRIWLANQFISGQLVIEDGKIVKVNSYNEAKPDLDLGNKRVVPGFIDIHTHGAFGYDTNDADPKGLEMWLKNVCCEGVTSILATTVTEMPDVLIKALKSIKEVHDKKTEGANLIGCHFEGPFLSMDYKGAQPPEAIQKASISMFKKYQEAAGGLIKYITLAPELDKDFELTRYLVNNGVVVSCGHSGANQEDAKLAVANGISSFTHVYNAMTPFKHRDIGLVGSAFRMRDTYGEIICDAAHSDPNSLNIYFKTKGADYAILVTDSIRCKHAPQDFKMMLGTHEIEVGEDGLARIKGTSTIAGSTLSVNKGLKILVEDALVPFDHAINSCTKNPAECLGLKTKGRLKVGYDADICVLNDDYSVFMTLVMGNIVYKN